MKFFVVLFLVILFILSYGLYAYLRITSIQNSSTNPPIQQSTQVFGSADKFITYVAAGDSTAVGQGASTVATTYPYLVAQYLASEYGQVDYQNVAVGGAKTQDVINSQLQQIIDAKPDIVTISIGANDITHLHTDASILKNDQTIINALLQQTSAQIYIADIPNFNTATLLPGWYRGLLEYKIKTLNPQLMALAQSRVHIVDIHAVQTAISSDQFHPSDIGYQGWANAFIDSIQETANN